ncbi:MAG: hypothetical protein HYZ22_04390 [Chloroflexi bacterium]|nr:hypothetical protein [Chloroflexota bacterium]
MNLKEIAVLTLLPILVVGLYIHFFGLNIPFWDQWYFVKHLMMQSNGQLTFDVLLSQHNEHRPFFPRLIWLVLAGFTHYNIKAELWTNLLIAFGTFAFFARRALRTWQEHTVEAPVFLLPLISLLLFNLGSRESWIQGFQTVMFLGMACIIIGVFFLTDKTWGAFITAILLGVVANFSMVNGLFYWALGAVLLIFNESGRPRIVKTIIWLAVSAITMGFFLNGWSSSAKINYPYLISHPFEWLVWLLNFLGAPILAFWYVAWVFGVLGVILFSFVVVQTVRSGKWRSLLPYLTIAVFVIGTTFVISLGRMEYGLRQSTVSRYLTMSAWFWVSLITLLPFVKIPRLRTSAIYLLLTASLTFLTIAGGWVGYVRLHLRILPAYQAVISGETISNEALAQIHPNPQNAGEDIDFLNENNLSAWYYKTK